MISSRCKVRWIVNRKRKGSDDGGSRSCTKLTRKLRRKGNVQGEVDESKVREGKKGKWKGMGSQQKSSVWAGADEAQYILAQILRSRDRGSSSQVG